MFTLEKHILKRDLFIAYKDAVRHKRGRQYVKSFNKDFENNMNQLVDELWNRTYKPKPSTCFIITRPKKREVFAADFRDRIVHHLYFNYTHELFERTFIADSYSCIKNRGNLYGIERLKHHIKSESENYTKKCYCLKVDIKGYFMHIDRNKLLDIALKTLNKKRYSKYSDIKTWDDVIDFEFIEYLTRTITLINPIENCIIKGKEEDWKDLPKSKSLFCVEDGCGLPIGNLTSQLFSNVYLNELDQYIKRVLKCRHYGRYVDDFFIVSKDKEFLKNVIPKIDIFLKCNLGLSVHYGKTRIINVKYGIEFLGGFIKDNRTYISNDALKRLKYNLNIGIKQYTDKTLFNSINSFLGVLCHYNSYNIRTTIFKYKRIFNVGYFTEPYNKYTKRG